MWLTWWIDGDFSQERKFIGGSQQISIKMAEKIGNDKVKYESPVSKIEQDDQGVRVTTLKGDVFEVSVIGLMNKAIPSSGRECQLACYRLYSGLGRGRK